VDASQRNLVADGLAVVIDIREASASPTPPDPGLIVTRVTQTRSVRRGEWIARDLGAHLNARKHSWGHNCSESARSDAGKAHTLVRPDYAEALTSLPHRDKNRSHRSRGRQRAMPSTIVHFECRNPEHLRSSSRLGVGGLVIHHGSVGYYDGVNVDGAHRWMPTGGVPIEYLYDTQLRFDGPGTYRAREGTLVHVRASNGGKLVVDVDGASRGDFHVGVKLSDDPDWPDRQPVHAALLAAD
jgi:hypothetical protein